MGDMAIDHGSELHLLRFMGRHRHHLDNVILNALREGTGTKVGRIDWLDTPFYSKHPQKDGELQGVDFLPDAGGPAWKAFWPDRSPGTVNRKGIHSWDAVGRVEIDGAPECLLVEAKAHLTG